MNGCRQNKLANSVRRKTILGSLLLECDGIWEKVEQRTSRGGLYLILVGDFHTVIIRVFFSLFCFFGVGGWQDKSFEHRG